MREKILHILPSLRRFSFALTGNQHDADDLLQSTVERLLKNNSPNDVDLKRWAFRVCRNHWIDEIRKRKIRVADNIDDISYSASGSDGEKVALSRITLEQINQAMNLLPENQRSTLSMVSAGGLTYAEVSEALDIPIGTVMSRVSRARKTLIQQFSATVADFSASNIAGTHHELH